MRYRIYTKTEKAWDAMLEAIGRAKSSIFLEMYIFSDDTSESHDFIERLSEKALSGVKVKVILDAFGSMSLPYASIEKLREAGVELFFFRALFRITHRKILIVDERIAFIGGINIRKFFKKWNDLLIKMEGKIVRHVLSSFAHVYTECGGKDKQILEYDKALYIQKGKVWFFEHFPPRNSFRLNKYYRDHIDQAHKKIMIVTPYFMPNGWVIKALKRASKRGVKIEIILPRLVTNPRIANLPNYLYMHKLHRYGIKFFLTAEVIHSKVMLVDGKEGILGSQNIDVLSFDFNMESGIFFSDEKLINKLNGIIVEWKKDSVPYSPKMRNNYFFDHFLDISLNIFEHLIKLFNRLTQAF